MARNGFAKLSPKSGRVSFSYLLPSVVIWCPPYARGLRYQHPFRGPLRLTNHNFHRHVQYCITFYYYICHIYTYRNVEGPKCHNFGRLGISYFQRAIRLTNYNFHADVHDCITIYYHMCSIDKYKNVEGPQCVSVWWGRYVWAQISQKCGRSKMPQFWKVRNIIFWLGVVLQNSPQKLWEFPPHTFSHLRWFDVPTMLGVWDIINLSEGLLDWQIITSMQMYTIVSLFTTICVVLTNTKMWKVHNVCLYVGGCMSELRSVRVS